MEKFSKDCCTSNVQHEDPEDEVFACEGNHYHTEELERNDNGSKKLGACCFNKMLNNVSQNDRAKAVSLCKVWRTNGIDLILCSMLQNKNVEIINAYKEWGISDPDRLTNIVGRIGCLEIYRLCEERKQRESEKHEAYCFLLQHAAFFGVTDIFNVRKERGANNFDAAMHDAARADTLRLPSCAESGGQIVSGRQWHVQLSMGILKL